MISSICVARKAGGSKRVWDFHEIPRPNASIEQRRPHCPPVLMCMRDRKGPVHIERPFPRSQCLLDIRCPCLGDGRATLWLSSHSAHSMISNICVTCQIGEGKQAYSRISRGLPLPQRFFQATQAPLVSTICALVTAKKNPSGQWREVLSDQ